MVTQAGSSSPYTLHVRAYDAGDANRSSGKVAARREYLRGVRAKVFWMEQLAKSPLLGSRDDVYLFTDLDIVPFGSYWELVRSMTHDIMFMPEVHHHAGLSDWVVNSGFYAFRLTPSVRRFLTKWAVMLMANRKLKDQDALNLLLLKRVRRQELDWGVFPSTLVTTNISEVTAATVAYHATNPAPYTKTDRLREAFARRAASRQKSVGDMARAGAEAIAEWCDPEEQCQRRNGSR
jgi:hypothetical protein